MNDTSKANLLSILDKIRGLPVLVTGDLVLDRYIWGKVDRISPEAPVPVVHVNRIEDRLGCAGNAVWNLCAIGAQVEVCGVVGNDDEGKIVQQLLSEAGVGKSGIVVDSEQPTPLKTRVIAHSQQVVRIDREELKPYSAECQARLRKVVQEKLRDARVLIVSDYGKGAITPEVLRYLSQSRKEGLIDGPVVVDPHDVNFEFYKDISVAKPNKAEAERASGVAIRDRASALSAAKILLDRWGADMMLITLGEDGMVVVTKPGNEGMFLETMAQEVYDVSGAGDTVTAVFSAALGVGADPRDAGALANIAAGLVVSEVGTVPVDRNRLRRMIEQGA